MKRRRYACAITAAALMANYLWGMQQLWSSVPTGDIHPHSAITSENKHSPRLPALESINRKPVFGERHHKRGVKECRGSCMNIHESAENYLEAILILKMNEVLCVPLILHSICSFQAEVSAAQ